MAPTARSSCSTAAGLLVVPVVHCLPGSVCLVPLGARTAHVSASGWWVACGQGASSAVSALPGEAAGGAWVSGMGQPRHRCGRLHPLLWMVVGGPCQWAPLRVSRRLVAEGTQVSPHPCRVGNS